MRTMGKKNNKAEIIPRALLRREDIKLRKARGTFVFVIPADKAELIKKEYGFSFEQLKVGGDISLAELAVHVDEQASLEARVSLVTEVVRYKLSCVKQEHEHWKEQIIQKVKKRLLKKEKSVTDVYVRGYIRNHIKHGKQWAEWEKKVLDLEFQYRIINNVFRQAVVVKGQLLPTLRNIVQGKHEGLGAIDVKVQKSVRVKLKT